MLASFRGINLCAVIATKPVGQPGAPGQDPAPLAGLLVWTWRLNLRYFLGRRESALSIASAGFTTPVSVHRSKTEPW